MSLQESHESDFALATVGVVDRVRRQAVRDAQLGAAGAMIGQPIAIHAAKKIDKGAADFAQDLMYGQHKDGGHDLATKLETSMKGTPDELMGVFGMALMPIGCVVAIAKLDAAFQLGEQAEGTAVPAASVVRRITSRPMPECFTVRYDDFGDYAAGRWAWLLRDVKALQPPAPMKGAQGFFDLPQGWLTEAA
jgi:hypothetical protein